METLIKNPLKQCSIGQAIVSAVKPRSALSPILFAMGIEMDHMFGSKWQLIELSRLRLSVSPDDVTRYKLPLVANENVIDIIKNAMQGSFSEWSRDNVDHNVSSLDGQEVLHGMGLVVLSTPLQSWCLKRWVKLLYPRCGPKIYI